MCLLFISSFCMYSFGMLFIVLMDHLFLLGNVLMPPMTKTSGRRVIGPNTSNGATAQPVELPLEAEKVVSKPPRENVGD